MTSSRTPTRDHEAGLGHQPVPADPARPLARAAWWGPRLVAVGLLLQCFSGQWGELGLPIPLDRGVLYAGLAVSVIAFFGRGGVLAVRPIHAVVAGSLAAATLSAVWAGTFRGSGLFALVDRFGLVPFLILLLSPALFPDTASRRFLARAFTALGLYLGLMALAQMLGLHELVWPRYIVDPSVGIHAERARGPYVESVANGLMLIYCAAFAGFVVAVDPSTRWRGVARLTVLLCLVGIVLTLTRAVWLGAAVALLATVIAVPRLRRRAPLLGVAVAGALVLAFVLVPGLGTLVSDRGSSQSPLWDRFNTNWAAVRMILERPLTGVGWGQSPEVMVDYVRQGASYPVTAATVGLDVHNVFLARFAELGIPAAVLWLATLAGATLFPLVRRAESSELQAWRAVLLPVVIAWATAAMFGPLTYPQPNYLLWCVAGIVLVSYFTGRRPPDRQEMTTTEPQPHRTGGPGPAT